VSNAADVVRRLEEAWASYDADTVRSLISPDHVQHTEHVGGGGDIDMVIQGMPLFRAAFPDCERTIEDLFAEGDKAVVRIRMRGTNEGGLPWFGIPANGLKVDVEWISIYRVDGDQVVEHWAQMDIPRMMMQLGAMPGMGGA